MQLYLNLLLPTDKHPCQSTIQRMKTPLTGSSTGWQWTEWSHWGTYPPTGEPLAVMTSTASITTKITSVEKLQILTSLPTLMVNAFRPSLSTSVVTLGYTRLRGIIPQVVTFLTSKVLQVDASFLFQVWAVETTLAFTALKTLCLPARGMPQLPRSGGLVATSSSHSDPLSLKLYKTRVLKWFAEQMKNFTKQPTYFHTLPARNA